MASVTDHEAAQIADANASGRTPVVFIHGLWLLAEQLGAVGGDVRAGGLRGPHPGLAG